MKTRIVTIPLLFAALVASNISCATNPDGSPQILISKAVTYGEVTNMPPFTARVEAIHISRYSAKAGTLAVIQLKRPDRKTRLNLYFLPAGDNEVNFALCLQEGQTYRFPGVFDDYRHTNFYHLTNRITRVALKPVDFTPIVSTNK